MKCLCHVKSACHRFGRIHLVDKCLLVILMLLMLQSAINLFLHESVTAETNVIDVVVRTSAAGIFGYIISINFNQHRKRHAAKGQTARGAAPVQTATVPRVGPTAQIGFQTDGGGEAPGATATTPPEMTREEEREAEHRSDRAQILVVAMICVMSLVVLLVFRNFMTGTDANASSLTQFRDFVSGGVGFLISCSTSGVNESK